jgi:hypothetical protein
MEMKQEKHEKREETGRFFIGELICGAVSAQPASLYPICRIMRQTQRKWVEISK